MIIKGLHLDPARRRLSLAKVLDIIEHMHRFGFNALHLHLTDDQGIALDLETLNFYDSGGWTIEEQRIIAQRCSEKNIGIIPEIDIPGHSVALRSLLEGGPYRVEERMGLITEGLIRLEHLPIILRIFEELCTRFNVTQAIHMGGDETRGASKEYFTTLVNTVCDWAYERGMWVIAWEDIFTKVEPPSNIILHRWKAVWSAANQTIAKIGVERVIYSESLRNNGYYLDVCPDLFSMYRRNFEPKAMGCIACTWGELISENNIDATLYPAIMLLGFRWNGHTQNPITLLDQYKQYIQFSGDETTWKRKQWTGFHKGAGQPSPRSTSSVTIHTVLNRPEDLYPLMSRFLVEMSIDFYKAMKQHTPIANPQRYADAFIEAGADASTVQNLFSLFAQNASESRIKTALRGIQRSQQAEEQLLYKNGLRMVIRELLRD